MRRRKMMLWATLAVAGLLGCVVAVALLLKYEPAFYRQAAIEPGPEREKLAKICTTRSERIASIFMNSGGQGTETFSAAEINSFFEEFFSAADDAEVLRKLNVSDLRIAMENGVFRLGFRYGSDPWSTVVSYDLKIWLARN